MPSCEVMSQPVYLSARSMLAAASYLGDACLFSIPAILATVFAISLSPALTRTMCAFLILCHVNPPLLDLIVSMLGLEKQLVKHDYVCVTITMYPSGSTSSNSPRGA
jgi:hypothetical protein